MVKFFGKGDILFLLGRVLAINRWKRAAVAACLAMLLVSPIIAPAKLIFEREKPNRANRWSFPSGDAAAATAFLIPIATAIPAIKPIAIECQSSQGFAGFFQGVGLRLDSGYSSPSGLS